MPFQKRKLRKGQCALVRRVMAMVGCFLVNVFIACHREDTAVGLWVVDEDKMRASIRASLLLASSNVTPEGKDAISDDLRLTEEAIMGTVSGTVLRIETAHIRLSSSASHIECRRLEQQAERLTVQCGKARQELMVDGGTLTWSLDIESAPQQQFQYIFKRADKLAWQEDRKSLR
jgi:hypothetical protein